MWKQAKKHLDRAIKLEPEHISRLIILARISKGKGEWQAALESLSGEIETPLFAPLWLPELHLWRAEIYDQIGDVEKAISDYYHYYLWQPEASEANEIKLKISKYLQQNEKGERDFSGANLREVDLRGANLMEAVLGKADLRGADLSGADLAWANLSGADLIDADLAGADLWLADLSRADLFNANLSEADLSEAYLFGADLTGADLTDAQVTNEQLAEAASLEGATLPDGTKHE
jgi:hypothetical protein